ncbi:MAG: MBL fold metallo-hydrolase [Phycisphaerales bacterium]|nr:MBL fold metallo-hydrolase [Phycisphaerales bacterium]
MLKISSFQFNSYAENTYCIYNEYNELIIVDPGCYQPNEYTTLIDFIDEKKMKPVQMILTHAHIDHIYGVNKLCLDFKIEPYMSALEVPVYEMAIWAGELFGTPVDKYEGNFHFIDETSVIKLRNDTLKILHTPGHSPGSLSFYDATQNWVISGDTLFLNSIGRTDFPLCNHNDLISAIQNKLYQLPDNTTVYSGHGHPTNIGYEKKMNPFVKAN